MSSILSEDTYMRTINETITVGLTENSEFMVRLSMNPDWAKAQKEFDDYDTDENPFIDIPVDAIGALIRVLTDKRASIEAAVKSCPYGKHDARASIEVEVIYSRSMKSTEE